MQSLSMAILPLAQRAPNERFGPRIPCLPLGSPTARCRSTRGSHCDFAKGRGALIALRARQRASMPQMPAISVSPTMPRGMRLDKELRLKATLPPEKQPFIEPFRPLDMNAPTSNAATA
jgi:hypothetical protein